MEEEITLYGPEWRRVMNQFTKTQLVARVVKCGHEPVEGPKRVLIDQLMLIYSRKED
jgi:hypothetical protein